MKKNVIVELAYTEAFSSDSAKRTMGLSPAPVLTIPGVTLDPTFSPVPLSGIRPSSGFHSIFNAQAFTYDDSERGSTYLVRGEMDESQYEKARQADAVVGIYSDPVIEPFAVCPGKNPVGTDTDVEKLLCVSKLKSKKMDGSGVLVAIVDTGVNINHLISKGKKPVFDASRSWAPQANLTPGSMPVDHGTMCAYDVLIAAPKATLLDIALLSSTAGGPTVMSGLLSDAIKAYNHLIKVKKATQQSLVVNNSWGMFHSSWDFPVGHAGNYSHNPNHPFNKIVGELEKSGADILFAAGNCGSDCPDSRCTRNGVTETKAIYGANSHPSVLTIAGVTKDKVRIGYSTQGPGCITKNKPDLSAYTHFKGSGVYAYDGGTSAACPVATGVIAAVRTVRGYDPANPVTSPAAIRSLVTTLAEDLTPTGYDLETGFGIIDTCQIITKLFPVLGPLPNFCKRYPKICEQLRKNNRFPKIPLNDPMRDLHKPVMDEEAIEELFLKEIENQLLESTPFLSEGAVATKKKVAAKEGDCGC